ncbi:TPA: hypothetical protein P0E30_003771 [Vibrio harveyi]|nr:hypothetical protein [Vibrio harveyi]
MPKIDVAAFYGERPKVPPRGLPNEYAVTAKDCQLEVGNLEPYKGLLDTAELLDIQHKTIFKFKDWWFKWTTDVDVAMSPVINDPWDRVYFTSSTGLRVTNNQIFNGSGTLPAASFPVGIPAPQNAIVAVEIPPNPLPAADDADDDETRFYVYTLVSEQGEEGPQSPISNQLDVKYPASTVQLTFSNEASLAGNVLTRRIYRSATEGGVSVFEKVADIPISQATFVDNVGPDDLGDPLESETFEAPNSKMKFIKLMPNGILAGGFDRTVCFSEPYLPHAFPPGYQLTTEHEIVAMETVDNMLLVGTKGNPWVFQGVSSDAISGRKLRSEQACVSKRSMRNIDSMIIYASANGLCAFTGGDVVLLTDEIIKLEQWQALRPETIEAYYYDSKYVAFYGPNLDKAFIFDPKSGSLTFHTIGSNLGFYDQKDGTLYVRGNDQRKLGKWNQGAPMSYTWRSKEYYAFYPTFSTLYIRSLDPANVGLRVIVDGNVIHNYRVGTLDYGATRIPQARGNSWQFEVYGTGIVEEVIIATSMAEVTI